MWALLAAALIGLPFLSMPGRYAFDTHDLVWFHPGAYLTRAFSLWRTTPYLGQEQHDGIIVPMAVVVWLLRSIGVSAWAAQRVWHGLLLFAATANTILLVDVLRARRTIVAPVAAGLLYSLTPYSFGYGLPFTPVWLPYVLLPLLLLVVIKGIQRESLAWAAMFGFVTLLMGGGNGAPQVYVLVTSIAFMAWLVFADRSVPLRTAVRFALWSLLFFVGMNAYWLFLLKSPEVSNALKFSEQPSVINVSSSASEAIRGLGFWQFYGGDRLGSWIPTVRPYVTNPLLVLTTFAVPIGGIVSAWLVRWRHRLFFALLGVAALFVSVGLFPVGHPTPFGKTLLFLYDHVPGFAGLRTTYKVTAEIALPVALLAGIGLEAVWRRLSTAPRRILPAMALAVAALVIGSNAFPLWTGHVYNRAHTTGAIPDYWRQALHTLDGRDQAYRAFFAPSTAWTTYTWGALKESITQTDPALNSVYPLRLPVALRYGSNLIAATEGPYLVGASPTGVSQLFRYQGVRDIVLQNDIDWERSNSARPAQMQGLLGDTELGLAAWFGAPGENVLGVHRRGVATAAERVMPPVQILTVSNPVPMIRAEGPHPVVVSGDGFGIAAAAGQGILDDGPAILYSGALNPSSLGKVLAQEQPSFIITDSNRRRVWFFSAPRAPHSATLQAGQTIGGRPIGYLLFGDRVDTQSVVVYPGVRSIASSNGGGPFGGGVQYRPANAFDGDPSTWWLAGAGSGPGGTWIQATFIKPMLLSSLTVSQPGVGTLRHITRIRIGFSDGSTVSGLLSPGRQTTISFPPRLTSSVRVRITRVGPSPIPGRPAGAAISDMAIPGLHPTETIRVPSDLVDSAHKTPGGLAALAASPVSYLFERAGSSYPGGPDEEARIVRRFEVAGQAPYTLLGSVHLNRGAGDAQIDQALFGPRSVRVISSSRYLGNPIYRGSSAIDGDPDTEWVPGGAEGEWLSIEFPRQTIDRITVDTSIGPTRGLIQRIKAALPDGTTAYGEPSDPQSGVIALHFPPVSTDRVTLFVDKVFNPFGGRPLPVGIREIHIAHVSPLHVDGSASLPCLATAFSLDGRAISVRADGTVGDLLSGTDLPLTTCRGSKVTLSAGWHDLLAGGALQPDVVRLSTPGRGASAALTPVESADLPVVHAPTSGNGSYDVGVRGAHGPFYLVIGQNYDPRWKASIDGRDLGPPVLLDGYSAGWRVTRPGSYVVSVRYGPQRVYTIALLLSGITVMLGLGVTGIGLRGRQRSTGS